MNIRNLQMFINIIIFFCLQIECLSNRPNVTAVIGNQPKILKKVLAELMDRDLIAQCNWTGNSKSVKTSFKKLGNIRNLLYDTVKKIDVNYTPTLAENHLKNKILRYANE